MTSSFYGFPPCLHLSDTHIGARLNPDLRQEDPHWGVKRPNKGDSVPRDSNPRPLVKDAAVLATAPQPLLVMKM